MVRLLNAPDTDTHLGLRDRAILETLYSTGMRLGELLALTLQDVDFSERHCFIRKGKGGKGRWAPLTHEACTFLQAYLDTARPRLVKARPVPQIFVGLRGRPLDRDGVRALCRLHARHAGITRRVWPHLLRHTAACHLLQNGASLFHVQLLLGHALPVTTQRYTAVTPGLMRSTLQACHPRA
jgi:site-specific recombinase XerD